MEMAREEREKVLVVQWDWC